MDFLKRLFGGGAGGEDSAGLYYYIRLKGSGEVVRVRINRNNDLSLDDDGKGFWVHKVVMGTTSFQRAEVELPMRTSPQPLSTTWRGELSEANRRFAAQRVR
ncbi:MAG: hypothetical protein U0521_10100 [Anaerolineae bacterium]